MRGGGTRGQMASVLTKQRPTLADDHILETSWPHLSLGPWDPPPTPLTVSMSDEEHQIHPLEMFYVE